MKTPESILYFPWFLSDWITHTSLILLTNPRVLWKQDVNFQTNWESMWLSYRWMRNQLKVQSISSHCPRLRCCFVFIPGYNHSKTSLPTIWICSCFWSLFRPSRIDMACHFMFQLCPGMQLISTFPSETCVCTAEMDQPGGPRVNTSFPPIPNSVNTVNRSGNKGMQVDKGSLANTEGYHHRESWFGPFSFTLFQTLSFQRPKTVLVNMYVLNVILWGYFTSQNK